MSRILLCLFVVLFSITSFAQGPTASDAPAVSVIRAGVLIDPETGTATADQMIRVEGGKVVAIGAGLPIPTGATVIDLSKSVVLPGLFDAHTHLCMDIDLKRDAGSYFYTTLQDPNAYRAIQGVVNARSMLEAGFTTVRDIGNEGNYACASVRRALERGLIVGPTMINAGRIIAPYGGQFRLQPDKRGLAEPEYLFADTRDEMRKAIRENIHYGARVIKIVVDDQRYIYSEDDIRFIVDEAAKAGMKVAAHAYTVAGTHNAAAAGVATMEHMNGISDDDLDLAKRNGVIAVFTPFPEVALRQFRATPEEARAEFVQVAGRLRTAHAKGVPIAFGSDAITELPGLTRGATAMEWLGSYSNAGLPPAEIVRAMTTIAARALGVDKQRGAIRVGLAADIIATAGNPLTDIDALKRVTFVMKDGQVVRNTPRQ